MFEKSGKFIESMLSYQTRNVKYQKEHGHLVEVLKCLANLSFMDLHKTFLNVCNVYKDKG